MSKLERNVQNFIGCESDYNDAKIVLFGAPFDSTTSYRPGTRFASAAIRGESYGIETYSPYQDKDLEDICVFDSGDLELPFGSPEQALADIEERASIILNDGKIPCMIGGEHLVTLGAVRAAAEKYPHLHIIHFDAHCDLREEYLGVTHSHATVMRRCFDILGDGKIYQYGIRSGTREEFRFAQKHTIMNKFDLENIERVIDEIEDEPVYFTLDLDVLDPREFPGTGTPEAGGASFGELMHSLEIISKLNIVAFDMNELSPHYDPSGRSTAIACKILREMLLFFY